MSCRGCGGVVEPATGSRGRLWCSDRCRKAAARGNGAQAVQTDTAVSDAVEQVLASVSFHETDPRTLIVAIVRKLGAAMDRTPTPAIARELRSQIELITTYRSDGPSKLDQLRARYAARRLDVLLGEGDR